MHDGRKNDRKLTLVTGRVLAPSIAADPIPCAVLNISQSGACILLPEGTQMSESCILEIDHDPGARKCKRVWQSGCRVGVTFNRE